MKVGKFLTPDFLYLFCGYHFKLKHLQHRFLHKSQKWAMILRTEAEISEEQLIQLVNEKGPEFERLYEEKMKGESSSSGDDPIEDDLIL